MASIRYLTLITHDKCEKLWLLFDDRLGKPIFISPSTLFWSQAMATLRIKLSLYAKRER